MKGMIMSALAGVLLATLSPADAWANPQHERMKRCNQEAREQSLKGDARKQFMSTCLKGKHDGSAAPAAAAAATGGKDSAEAAPAVVADAARTKQKDKMKACNQQAGEQSLKGDARKTFMAECLKG